MATMSLASFSLLWFSSTVALSTMNHLLFTTSPLLQLHSREHLFLLLQWIYLSFVDSTLIISKKCSLARAWSRSSQWVYSMPLAMETRLKMGRGLCMVHWQSPVSFAIERGTFFIEVAKTTDYKFRVMVGILSPCWRNL